MQQLSDLLRPTQTPKHLLLRSRYQLTIWAYEQLMHYAHHGGYLWTVAKGLYSQCTEFQPAVKPSILCLACLLGVMTTVHTRT